MWRVPRGAAVTALIWAGILLCLLQSAVFSGLNLALFSLNRLELAVAAAKGDPRAARALAFREDANFALVTVLWGNVAVNVALALLSGSVMAGVTAFVFSTVVITLLAEVLPQSVFSRHALVAVGLLGPLLRLWQVVLWPVARPTALVLDRLLGPEAVRYYPERDLRAVIRLHMEATESEIARAEGQGALNFLDIDDVPLAEEGEPLDPDSILTLPFEGGRPVFPDMAPDPADPFLRRLAASGRSWAVIADPEGRPRLVLNVAGLIRDVLFAPGPPHPLSHCHRPIVTDDPQANLGGIIPRFRLHRGPRGHEVVEDDVVLLWTDAPRIVTGSDILGRLLRGIARSG